MRQIRCIVIDDEKPARDGLVDYIQRLEFIELVGTAKNAKEAQSILKKETVELMFLDIQMPGISGIDFVKNISEPPMIIFTTAYREFAVEGFELSAVDYLVKPISYERFSNACSKAQKVLTAKASLQKDEKLFIKEGTGYVQLSVKEIVHLQAADDYVFIHIKDGKRYMVLMPLKDVLKQLPEKTFIRTHRSHVVNKKFVTALEGSNVLLGEKKVPISRLKATEVKSRLIAENIFNTKE